MTQGIETTPGVRHKIEKVAPDNVSVDLRVQRPLDEKRVRELVDDFAIFAIGVLVASRREDGSIIYLDGQTRAEALRRKGMGARPVPTTVYEGLTLEQEAEMFRRLNNSKKASASDLFRIAVTERDPIAIKANKALETYGWTAESSRKNTFRAVNTIWTLIERNEKVAKQTLMVLSGTWGATTQAAAQGLLQGMFMFIERYGEPFRLDMASLMSKLAQTEQGDTPAKFLGRCRANRSTRGISIGDAVADILVTVYNKGRRDGQRGGRVPTWSV